MLDKWAVITAATNYAKAVQKEFSPDAIILFGSYTKGEAREESDIDIAVVFNGFTGDWLKASNRLWRLTEDISSYIEPILLDSTTDKSGFVSHIYKTGQIIYQR
ncbi:MAG: nucleotidyltransferase domain-containing protein [Defluviitaleaceae bacterium]|nr:nucleotidyltransferase domain-containing protein [Defluviitaleaceae bacterium]MCL2262593.1 nucleotidyltransferase domain-containing protein [Defluviitaleaceae bacterium]